MAEHPRGAVLVGPGQFDVGKAQAVVLLVPHQPAHARRQVVGVIVAAPPDMEGLGETLGGQLVGAHGSVGAVVADDGAVDLAAADLAAGVHDADAVGRVTVDHVRLSTLQQALQRAGDQAVAAQDAVRPAWNTGAADLPDVTGLDRPFLLGDFKFSGAGGFLVVYKRWGVALQTGEQLVQVARVIPGADQAVTAAEHLLKERRHGLLVTLAQLGGAVVDEQDLQRHRVGDIDSDDRHLLGSGLHGGLVAVVADEDVAGGLLRDDRAVEAQFLDAGLDDIGSADVRIPGVGEESVR
ncbi:hypothetical protein [Deinococcus rubellus]|uniref:hypothetical protein n=1 Tax=Deinococcus rubellus TaxID=1889240 RepID=UPI00406BC30F